MFPQGGPDGVFDACHMASCIIAVVYQLSSYLPYGPYRPWLLTPFPPFPSTLLIFSWRPTCLCPLPQAFDRRGLLAGLIFWIFLLILPLPWKTIEMRLVFQVVKKNRGKIKNFANMKCFSNMWLRVLEICGRRQFATRSCPDKKWMGEGVTKQDNSKLFEWGHWWFTSTILYLTKMLNLIKSQYSLGYEI
jgi:hypothetical protein